MIVRRLMCGIVVALGLLGCLASAQGSAPVAFHQTLDDAWWTGPMLAPSANTLPRGHILLEPYLFDVSTQGFYNSSGKRVSAPHSNGFGSLTYMNYGLANKLTVGLIPTFGYNQVSDGPSSAGVGAGDLTGAGAVSHASISPGRLDSHDLGCGAGNIAHGEV
jgi:hypothetical protein